MDEAASAPAALLSSPASLRSRCEEILCELMETQRGLGREWKNVQPCVVRASQLLLQQAQQHDERLGQLEDKMTQVLNAVEVIASDCRLKEQRYRMDRESTERAVQELQRSIQQLHDAVATERRASHQFREETLYPGLADLQQQIDHLSSGAPAHVLPSQPPQQLSPSATLAPPPPPLPAAVFEAATDSDRREGAEGPAMKEMIREVRLLRNQWQQLLQQSQSAMPVFWRCAEGKPRMEAKSSMKNRRVLLSMVRPSVDCSTARWHWRGGHVPTPTLSPDSPIPWSTLHLRKTTTGEWLSVGAAPDGTATHPELSEGGGPPFLWRPRRPSSIELLKAGIYRVTVCLLSSCYRRTGGNSPGSGGGAASSVPPSVSLRVNDRAVFSFFTGGSTCYALQPAEGAGRQNAPAPHGSSSNKTASSCQASACPRRLCNCSALAACTTSTFADFLRLPAGSCVSVHCHDAADAGAAHEALLEVEFIAG
ncbi:uncharacterized protein Tco025E_02207 [Trypanosoma conorhini]|uniref:Uncharacterized protein n=1 Tax=Trypanosoma conorhini TaxID=83891 RepID=A0A3S5IUG2_9TRYP|nr:uncharacterized protein Tco025E_02207 [Trypanosoma conorhini]RNF25647.1 hypothetical protein Tco025E_02207 [Trypanosoma conorhini]